MGAARALSTTPIDLAAVAKTQSLIALSWLGRAAGSRVAVRLASGRVLVPVFTAADTLDVFADFTERRSLIDWGGTGSATVVVDKCGPKAFDVLELDCDGVIVDPAGPEGAVEVSLERCAKIVQAGTLPALP